MLRRWTVDDAPALHEAVLASVEHLRPWMAWVAHEPMTLAERRGRIATWDEAWRAGGDVVYGAWRDGVVVGGSGLHRRIGEGGLEIGYWVHVDHVGQGVATAVARAATAAAFTVAGIDRVEIHHDVANRASGRVPDKLGYEQIGDGPTVRGEQAPAETGIDRIWRTTCATWATSTSTSTRRETAG